MTLANHSQSTANPAHLKLLYILRNLLIVSELFGILLVYYGLNIPIPSIALGFILSIQILFNVYTWNNVNNKKTVSSSEIFIQLCIDVICLSAILYFTGGATNPFIIVFLFPIIVAITILPIKTASIFALVTISFYSGLMIFYEALPINHNMHEHSADREYNLHIIGMWLAFVIIAGLITYTVYNMSNVLRHQQKLLTNAKQLALEDEQLVNLGALATNTIHEINEPLTRIANLSAGLETLSRERTIDPSDLSAYTIQLEKEIENCYSTLSDLSIATNPKAKTPDPMDTGEFLQNILDIVYDNYPETEIKTQWTQQDDVCLIIPKKSLSLALINIIRHSIDSTKGDIFWKSTWNTTQLSIEITEFEIRQNEDTGLDIFIAQALIKRLGGNITQTKLDNGKVSTIINLQLYREDIES